MMNSAPAVVSASDGLAAFSRSSRKGTRSCLGAGWRLRVGRVGPSSHDQGHGLFLSNESFSSSPTSLIFQLPLPLLT